MYVFRQTEPNEWTVGFYNDQGAWCGLSAHASQVAASEKVASLNKQTDKDPYENVNKKETWDDAKKTQDKETEKQTDPDAAQNDSRNWSISFCPATGQEVHTFKESCQEWEKVSTCVKAACSLFPDKKVVVTEPVEDAPKKGVTASAYSEFVSKYLKDNPDAKIGDKEISDAWAKQKKAATRYRVVDSPFNQANYKDLIGKEFDEPPSYVQVELIKTDKTATADVMELFRHTIQLFRRNGWTVELYEDGAKFPMEEPDSDVAIRMEAIKEGDEPGLGVWIYVTSKGDVWTSDPYNGDLEIPDLAKAQWVIDNQKMSASKKISHIVRTVIRTPYGDPGTQKLVQKELRNLGYTVVHDGADLVINVDTQQEADILDVLLKKYNSTVISQTEMSASKKAVKLVVGDVNVDMNSGVVKVGEQEVKLESTTFGSKLRELRTKLAQYIGIDKVKDIINKLSLSRKTAGVTEPQILIGQKVKLTKSAHTMNGVPLTRGVVSEINIKKDGSILYVITNGRRKGYIVDTATIKSAIYYCKNCLFTTGICLTGCPGVVNANEYCPYQESEQADCKCFKA